MYKLSSILLCALPLASAAVTLRSSTQQPFQLYAYGPGIGGFPVFADGHLAYIGNGNKANSTEGVALVHFNIGSDSTWTAAPNTTTGTAPFTNATFYVPGSTSSSHQVGFLDSNVTVSDASTDGFLLYGQVVIKESSAGAWETLWYALPTSTADIWSLNWNTTGDSTAGKVLVTLKTTPPSAGNGPTPGAAAAAPSASA